MAVSVIVLSIFSIQSVAGRMVRLCSPVQGLDMSWVDYGIEAFFSPLDLTIREDRAQLIGGKVSELGFSSATVEYLSVAIGK